MFRTLTRLRLGLAAAAVAATLVTTATTVQAEQLPEGNLAEAVANYVNSPGAVPGANDWNCRPTATHPNPVIMLPGTFANIGANFVKLSPLLKNNGYCVFGMNYGFTAVSAGRMSGLDTITTSASQLDAFVQRVRAATGAAKVDLVGHSQGGYVPMWWLKKMGGAAEVAHYVGWAPSSHGTTLNGLAALATTLHLMGFANTVANVGQFPGVVQQQYDSAQIRDLWSDGDAVPDGPQYTVIATRFDHVVTPYDSQFLTGSGVHNVLLQDVCATDGTGHVGLAFDEPTQQLTLNALSDGPTGFRPACAGYGPPGM